MGIAAHRAGDCYVAKLEDPDFTLVVSYTAYQRWAVVIMDRATNCTLLDLHEENTLEQAQRYAEGYVQGICGKTVAPQKWMAQGQ